MEYISNSLKDTKKIAKKIAKKLSGGDIVLLEGDLGAGKTTLVKSIVDALGGKEDEVTSPTFTIVNQYKTKNADVYHFDLYRIENENELFNIGVEDYIYSGAISFVEWPERAPSIFETSKKITINKLGDSKRQFICEGI